MCLHISEVLLISLEININLSVEIYEQSITSNFSLQRKTKISST